MSKNVNIDGALPKRGARALKAAIFVWVLCVVMPSALMKPLPAQHNRASWLVASQVGDAAVPYLSSAPQALIIFLVMSFAMALPVLLLLSKRVHARIADASSMKALLCEAQHVMVVWLSLHVAGLAMVAGIMLARGAAPDQVASWGLRLGLFEFLSTLPVVGWVLGLSTAIRRFWRVAVVAVGGGLICAFVSSALLASSTRFPTPAELRLDLLSGRANIVSGAALGLVAWGVGLILAAGAMWTLRTAKPVTAAKNGDRGLPA